MSRGGQGDFLARWSRLKREGAGQAEPAPEPASPPPAERTDAEILAEHGLPDPDTLSPGDDVRGFMVRAIPDRLRNRALRRLWLGNPALANLDGLVDYGEDFTDAATVIDNLASAWQAGRGYLKAEPEPEPEPEPDAGPGAPAAAGAEDEPAGPDAPDEVADAARVEPAPAHGQGNALADDPPAGDTLPDTAAAPGNPPPPPMPRRMRFRV